MFTFSKTKLLFESLLAEISKTRPKYVSTLKPGLEPKLISSVISIQPVPEELVAIYSCVTGVSLYSPSRNFGTIDDLDETRLWDFIPGYGLMSVFDINEAISSNQTVKSEFPDDDDWWEADMIPFLTDFSGNYYCVRTLKNDNTVVYVNTQIGCRTKAVNLYSFLEEILERYRNGIYFVDEDGWLAQADKHLSKTKNCYPC
jgi:hypothetical protein